MSAARESLTCTHVATNGAVALALIIALTGCETGTPPLRVATTTSVENSGLLTAILPTFERESGLDVEVLSVGSGQALNLIGRGEAVVGITHDPPVESSSLKDGIITAYRKFMFNDFLIVGPASDPAGVRGAADAGKAFYRITIENVVFVSRGDDSGTYSREQELWKTAGQRPSTDRLLETGQGMGATLRVASEREAYTLTDRATFEQFRSKLRLVPVHEGPDLLNTYSVFLRTGAAGPQREAGLRLADWLADGRGRMLIADFLSNGRQVFHIWPAGAPRTRPSDLPLIEPVHAR